MTKTKTETMTKLITKASPFGENSQGQDEMKKNEKKNIKVLLVGARAGGALSLSSV